MAILPNVVYPPNILRPRTVIENSLSGGGIAGVVLGSLCGLLILLIIFWTYAQRKRRGSRNTQSRRQCDPRGDGVPNLEQHAKASTRESTVPTQAVPGITPLEIDSITTVNPWKVEYQPNPVMFPHLSAPIGNIHYEDEEEGVVFSTNQTSLRRPESIIEVCSTRSNSFGTPSAIYAAANGPGSRGTSPPLQAINIRSSGDSVPPLKSSRSDLPMDNILPVITSEVPTTYESKSPCQSGLGTVEIINTTPIKSSELYPGNSDTGVTVVSSPRSFTEASSSTRTLSLQASSRTSPTGNPSVSKVTIFPSKSIEADTDPVYPCSICHLKFRTPGLRRTHQNRKHNLRYSCGICDSRFGLRADLRRHENSVHRGDLHDFPTKVFQCPNIGCSDPQKTYARKDNFSRHVNRCERAIVKAKSLHDAGMEKREGNHRHWKMPSQTREHDPDVAM